MFLNTWPQYKTIKGLSFLKGDVQNFDFPAKNFDFLLHFATPASAALNLSDPLKMTRIIVDGTIRVLEFAREANIKKVLFASSGAVYGKQPSDLPNVPESYLGAPLVNAIGAAYGESKRMAELVGCEYSRKFGFEFKIARCFAFAGPHLDSNGSFAIGNFIRDSIKGTSINISGDGSPLRSYLYSDDLILWLLKILLEGENHEPYNVGSDYAISIADLAAKVIQLVNPTLQLNIAKTKDLSKPPERYVPSIEKAKSKLNLKIWTDLDSTILKTHAAYLSRN